MAPIVTSLLDTDLYKVTMAGAAWEHYPTAHTEWRMACRTPGVDLRPIEGALREHLAAVCDLRFTAAELAALRSRIDYLKAPFLEFLRCLRLNLDQISIERIDAAPGLEIRVAGPWCFVTWWEIVLLTLVSELYFRHICQIRDAADESARFWPEGTARLKDKIATMGRWRERNPERPFRLVEFGTRRRFSRAWHRQVVTLLKEQAGPFLWGTSNVDLALDLGVRPIGTFAHEWVQCHQALTRLEDHQRRALDAWAHTYRGRLGIALSDCLNLDAFLRDFDLYFAKLFDGCRHDSGDPRVWTRRLIEHYRAFKIDPSTKAAVYSDSLTIDKALALADEFEGQIQTSFGIGTHLTNDVGVAPLNLVCKVVRCNGSPVAKISDAPSKSLCEDPHFLEHLARVFGIPSPVGVPRSDPAPED